MRTETFTLKRMGLYLLALVPCLAFSLVQAGEQNVYFADDFSLGMVHWDVSGDSWQATSLFYRSPGYCASDSPNGNYPWSANSIMTMKLASRVDLSKSTYPVLRFWHRIGVCNGDYGYVEISQDYGFTWKELRSYTNTWRSTWSFEQIDLSAYKASAKPILIRFRLRDDGFGHNSETWGWDIDDVEIRERDAETIPFPFFDDVESGIVHWMLQAGDAWQPTENASVSPIHSLSESPNGNYPWSACSDLVLAHPIEVPSSGILPVLTFWHRIGVCNGDCGYVDVSQDYGCTWKTLTSWTNVWLANWTLVQIDLSGYKGSPILIRFRLRDDGFGHNSETWGWDIDDVAIRDLFYPPDLAVQIVSADSSACPTIRATALVTNANGVAITGLEASDFCVREDKNLRMPITVVPDTAVTHVALALDNSGSMPLQAIRDMEAAAKTFVSLMDPNDGGEVIKFSTCVDVLQKFTLDKGALLAAITHTTTCAAADTSLYDAVYQALSDTAAQPGNKAVVVMSDGRDNRSGHSATEVINYAKSKGISIFAIGLGGEVDETVLTMMAVQTGGVYYFTPKSSDLTTIYQKIAGAIKNQYVVTFESAVCKSRNAGNAEHELEIVVVDGPSVGQGTKRFNCPPTCNSQAGAQPGNGSR